MAGQFLKAAALSTKSVIHMMELTKRQIEVTMFATGAGILQDLKNEKLVKT
jgi:isopentenyl diphosphate isomerase/L-lactate dehydrogenase-like FMN-dependent dehydrogenase